MPSGLFVASSNRGISSREFYSLSFPNGENSYVRKRLRNVINAFEIGRGRKERKEGRWRRRFDRRDVSTCTPQVFLRFIRLIEYGRRCKLRSSSFPSPRSTFRKQLLRTSTRISLSGNFSSFISPHQTKRYYNNSSLA